MFEPFRRFPNFICLLIIFVGILLGLVVAVLTSLGAVDDIGNVVPFAFALELISLVILAIGGSFNIPNTLNNICGGFLGTPTCCCAKIILFFSALIAILLLTIVAAGITGFFAVFLAASAVFTSFFSLAVYLYCLICT